MKIGFFTDSYFPRIDGVTYTLSLWRDSLEAAGHEVWIVYPESSHDPGDRELPVPSLPNPFYPGYRIPLARRVSRLPELDLVHSHGPGPAGLLGLYYARRKDLPSVYTHHTPIEEYFHQSIHSERLANALARAYVPVETAVLRQFDVVTASTSRIDRPVAHTELPVGIDTAFFRPSPLPDRDPARQPLIGYSGRISMEKNVGEILAAARELSACDFLIVGEGPRRAALESRAPRNVTFRDFLPREALPEFYSTIDAFVTASTADTLGLSTLEANACGTPVAAADVAPFTETIGPENGVRFEYGDTEAMVAAIDQCVSGRWSTRDAVAEYAVDETIATLEQIYERLCGEESSPARASVPEPEPEP